MKLHRRVGVDLIDGAFDPSPQGQVGKDLPGGKVVEHRLFELMARDGPLAHLYLAGKDAPVGQAQHGALLGPLVVGGVQVVDEHEIGHLFHHVQGVGDAAGPEGLPLLTNDSHIDRWDTVLPRPVNFHSVGFPRRRSCATMRTAGKFFRGA